MMCGGVGPVVAEGDSLALVPVEDADGSVHGSASGEPASDREALELADSILERFDTSDFDQPDAIYVRREVGKMVFEKAVAWNIADVGALSWWLTISYSGPSWVLKMPHCL